MCRARSRWTALVASGLLLSLVGGCSSGGSARAQTQNFCVNPTGSNGCFSTISAAVAAASPGQLITVEAGTYKEMVSITKPLDLEGSDVPNAPSIIDASGLAHGIYIAGVTTGPTTVRYFEVEDANREGILAENSTQVTLAYNLVESNDKALDTSLFVQGTCPTGKICCPNAFPMDQDDCGEGLHLRGVMQSTVMHNEVTGNAGGILLTDETGPNAYNLIAYNASQNNVPDCGITLPSHALCGAGSNDSAGCVGGPQIGKPANGVFSNIVSGNLSQGNGAAGVGIFTPTPGTTAHSNLVQGNLLEDNAQGGVVLHSHAAGQDLNDNNIVGNLVVGNGTDPGVTTVPAGIIVFADGSATNNGNPAPAAPLTGINIEHNAISDESIDVFVGTKVATSLTLSLNDLSGAGNAVGVNNAGTGTVAAMGNWWGCTAGPGADPACATIQGSVLTQPPLTAPVTLPSISSLTQDASSGLP